MVAVHVIFACSSSVTKSFTAWNIDASYVQLRTTCGSDGGNVCHLFVSSYFDKTRIFRVNLTNVHRTLQQRDATEFEKSHRIRWTGFACFAITAVLLLVCIRHLSFLIPRFVLRSLIGGLQSISVVLGYTHLGIHAYVCVYNLKQPAWWYSGEFRCIYVCVYT